MLRDEDVKLIMSLNKEEVQAVKLLIDQIKSEGNQLQTKTCQHGNSISKGGKK